MLGAAAFVIAFSAMAFSGASALTLFYAIRHLDPPDMRDADKGHDRLAA